MKDRFKFRIFCISENKMMLFNTPTLIDGDIQQGGLMFKNYNYKIINCHELNPKDLKLMQCTGLKDKKGKLIFEGDILKNYRNTIYKLVFEENSCGFLLYEPTEQEYYYPCYNCDQFKNRNICNMEIIGNIYENPELFQDNPKRLIGRENE